MSDLLNPAMDSHSGPDTLPGAQSHFQHLPVSFTGKGLDYFILVFKTTLLTILSFGLYYPWARGHRLNYLYRNTRIGHQNLAFYGTGREIAIGYIKGLLIYGVAYGSLLYAQSLADSLPVLAFIGIGVFSVIVYGLFPIAIWGGRAYRGSRLSYRGIRLGMDKPLFKPFVLKTFLDMFLTFITLGLYLPFMLYNFNKRLVDGTLWGNENFHFEDSRKESVRLSFSNFFMALFSLGLLFPVTIVRRIQFNFAKTRFQKMEVVSDLKWTDGYVIFLFPLVVATFSLGLLYPWANVFATKRFYSKIRLSGELNFASIIQGANEGNALGETASSLLDFDTGLGV